MLDYSEILPRKVILFNEGPYEVISAHVFQKQMRRPVNATKLKNLISGKVIETTFQQSDKVPEAEIGERKLKYLYVNRGEHWFCDSEDPKDRFALSPDVLGETIKFVRANTLVSALTFNDIVFTLSLPPKVDLKVIESAPAVRGNTSGNATKAVVLETGATVYVPMFINEGDTVRINTETSAYAERVEKA